MEVPPAFENDWAQFPGELRELVEAEVAVGNRVLELGHGFPAPPAGAYVKLERAVTTRPRASTNGIRFFERNSSLYRGEFCDERRFYFVIEAPLSPPPEVDMDSLRAAYAPKPFDPEKAKSEAARVEAELDAVERFRRSLWIDYGKWKDGIGYDLAALRAASPEERAQICSLLLARPISDWRDIEALAALDTPAATSRLRDAARSADPEIALAVQRHAPHLVDPATRSAQLVQALESAELFGGLGDALDEVASFHPPAVVDALLRGALRRRGEAPVHFAAMLSYLHGKAREPFDWAERPFFLRFLTDDVAERAALFRELCARIGIDPDPYEVAAP